MHCDETHLHDYTPLYGLEVRGLGQSPCRHSQSPRGSGQSTIGINDEEICARRSKDLRLCSSNKKRSDSRPGTASAGAQPRSQPCICWWHHTSHTLCCRGNLRTWHDVSKATQRNSQKSS